MIWILAYAATGAIVGWLAGLLGIGGGMTLVPILAAMFAAQQLAPDFSVHLTLATGMASVMFTSSASVREHHKYLAVDWVHRRRMAPGMVIGTLLSTISSSWIPQRVLALAFALIVFAGATQILLGRKPAPGRTMPGTFGLVSSGILIGVVCGLVSAGGAFLTVPFMLFCGVSMPMAIGTGAALGVPVAVVGTIGYVLSGLRAATLPSTGASASSTCRRLQALVATERADGALRRTGRPSTAGCRRFKRIFACLLYLLAIHMIVTHW